MKTMTKAQPKKKTTQFVLVTPELQINNEQVLKAYTKIVEKAVDLLKPFEMRKYRIFLDIDHKSNPENHSLVKEHISHFFNITLSNAKDGRSYIFIDCDESFISRFGSNMANRLAREAYKLTHSEDGTAGIEYSLRFNFMPQAVASYYYKMAINGETEIISIITAEQAEVA